MVYGEGETNALEIVASATIMEAVFVRIMGRGWGEDRWAWDCVSVRNGIGVEKKVQIPLSDVCLHRY